MKVKAPNRPHCRTSRERLPIVDRCFMVLSHRAGRVRTNRVITLGSDKRARKHSSSHGIVIVNLRGWSQMFVKRFKTDVYPNVLFHRVGVLRYKMDPLISDPFEHMW